MGRRGPAPTPTAILRLVGSRAIENRSPDEPMPPIGVPICPEWLEGRALEKWEELIPQLENLGVLTQIDGDALAQYCSTWDLWRKAVEWVKAHGTTYQVKKLNPKTKELEVVGLKSWPYVKQINDFGKQLAQLAQQFGLTPSARTRIRIEESAKPRDPLGAFAAERHEEPPPAGEKNVG